MLIRPVRRVPDTAPISYNSEALAQTTRSPYPRILIVDLDLSQLFSDRALEDAHLTAISLARRGEALILREYIQARFHSQPVEAKCGTEERMTMSRVPWGVFGHLLVPRRKGPCIASSQDYFPIPDD